MPLTIPASVTKRKQACNSCRQRKKKCGAERPTCSLCSKWGIKCEYGHVASTQPTRTQIPNDITEDIVLAFNSVTYELGISAAIQPSLHFNPAINFERPIVEDDDFLDLENPLDSLEAYQLPPQELLEELVELFFDNLHHVFPCFHLTSFKAKVRSGDMVTESSLVLYAICCLSARHHRDESVRTREKCWYEQAKFHYEITRKRPDAGLRTIQSCLLIMFHALTIGNYSASWFLLGKAWRQIVMLGLNRMDSGSPITMSLNHPYLNGGIEGRNPMDRSQARTMVEAEECRRTLWLLFIMDRIRAWPTGWPHTISESQYKVDMPIADTLFQALDPEMLAIPQRAVSFSKNIDRLIGTLDSAKQPLNMFHYIAVAHVLLGRVAELIHSLHDDPSTVEYAEDCAELDAMVVQFRLNIPQEASSIMEAPIRERAQVLWLQVTLSAVEMLLHYRNYGANCPPEESSKFRIAVNAARNIARIVRDASQTCVNMLISSHVAASFYVAACVLIIQWRTTGQDGLAEEIELIRLVFERMNELYTFQGVKYSTAIEFDMKRSPDELSKLRERGYKGLLADCSTWKVSFEEALRRSGIAVDIT